MLAPGASAAKKVDIEGADAEGVHWGLDFLRACRDDEKPEISGDVVVIGANDRAEIWDKDRWYESDSQLTSDAMAAEMDNLNF